MSKVEDLVRKYCEGSSFEDACMEKPAYIAGYHQAEKDLALTWEDISIIRQITYDYNRQVRNEMSVPQNEEYCKEILKRFNEERSKR